MELNIALLTGAVVAQFVAIAFSFRLFRGLGFNWGWVFIACAVAYVAGGYAGTLAKVVSGVGAAPHDTATAAGVFVSSIFLAVGIGLLGPLLGSQSAAAKAIVFPTLEPSADPLPAAPSLQHKTATAPVPEDPESEGDHVFANVVKEFHEPLDEMVGNIGELLETELSVMQRERLEAIKKAAASLSRLAGSAEELSEAEAGEDELEISAWDMHAIFGEIMKEMSPRAAEKGLHIGYSIAPGIPETVYGDKGRLRRVLLNLLGNACKFTDKGEITVRACKQVEDNNDSMMLRFDIIDTGSGIGPAAVKSVFEPFGGNGGSGVGLAVCKKLVESMDGRIAVESTPGKGSNFWFTVRVGKTAPAEDTAEKSSNAGNAATATA